MRDTIKELIKEKEDQVKGVNRFLTTYKIPTPERFTRKLTDQIQDLNAVLNLLERKPNA